MLTRRSLESLFLFLTLLFLPTQLGRHFWPQFSYIYSLKIDYLSPVVYFWDLIVIALCIIWTLGRPKVNKSAVNLFLIFALTQLLSLIFAKNTGAAFVRLEQYLIAGLFGIYLASQEYKRLEATLYRPLLIGLLGEFALAFFQVVKGASLGLWILGERTFTITTPAIAKFDFYGREILRPYATFPHPNVLAGYFLTVIFLLKNRIRWWLVMFAGIGILLTMSRSAIAATLLSGAVLLKKKWLVFAGVLLLLISPIIFTRFFSLWNFDNLSLVRREQLAEASLQLFFKNPFFGIGLNNFIPAVADNLITGPSRFLQPVHNIFLLSLAETGLIGVLGFLIFIFYPMNKSRSYLPFMPVIFLGLLDHYFLTLPAGYRMLFLVWGLALARVKMTR